jgi:membrane protein implicated in regulation of membrane protease activity
MYAMFAYLVGAFIDGIEALAANAYGNAGEAAASALAAESSATAAAVSEAAAAVSALSAASAAGAAPWASGQSYVAGECCSSLIDFQTYRAMVNTSGTVDPKLAPAVWRRLGGEIPDFILINQGVH